MKDLYRNPFGGVNAVQLDIQAILEYWCNPFMYDLFSEIKEDDIYQDTMNIVFMGGRSTGKSMFLRYWSYPVQFEKAKNEQMSLKDVILKNKGVGFYFRIDGPVLRSFQGNGISNEKWDSIFAHYFELIVGRQYLEIIKLLIADESLDEKDINDTFIPEVSKYIGSDSKNNISELIEEFDDRIKDVDVYRGDVAFYKNDFEPKGRGFSSQTLSFGLADLIKGKISFFKDLNLIILLDEYENFLESQQVIINTLLRFTKPQIKFRIGMRLEGFRTYKMIADEDFIKEGREYRKVVFEEVLNKDTGYQDFLKEICKKRLESVPIFKEKGFTDITKILSDSENLEMEAIELAANNPDRLYEFFSKRLPKESLDKVRYPENPLLELLNYIWLTRGVSPEHTSKAMNDYLSKTKTAEGKKYHMDYVDKYKLSLVFLLCSVYRKNKLYYSFNTFAFLSSGIVGHFIELCRRSFAMAGWGDNDTLINQGIIAKEHQSKAAMDFSIAEKQQISRIEKHGGSISKFIGNIGNIFREYHLDFRLRYPETNQFAINVDGILNEDLKGSMKSAIKWSVIQRKPRMQKSAPSESLQDTYTVNRIFSPSFQISYRTRGGKSLLLDEKQLEKLMTKDNINASEFLPQENTTGKLNQEEPNLFSDI